jgi:hypothetical protein
MMALVPASTTVAGGTEPPPGLAGGVVTAVLASPPVIGKDGLSLSLLLDGQSLIGPQPTAARARTSHVPKRRTAAA